MREAGFKKRDARAHYYEAKLTHINCVGICHGVVFVRFEAMLGKAATTECFNGRCYQRRKSKLWRTSCDAFKSCCHPLNMMGQQDLKSVRKSLLFPERCKSVLMRSVARERLQSLCSVASSTPHLIPEQLGDKP